ncbi:MAG: tetratricopeptide repeat protein [Lachnospiraceae bacterium]|nr:tetratricopeptide repeat protein [Lachnospiraceae bacterium]
MNRKITSKIFIILAVCVMIPGLIGCGSVKLGEHTEAGMIAVSNHDYALAMDSFAKAEENGEDSELLARGRGIASYYMMDYENSVNYYLEALSYSSGIFDYVDYDINFYLASSYEKLDNWEKAVSTYTAILDLHDDDVMAYYRRGTDYLIMGEHDLAIADFDKALELDEDNYDLRIEIAGRLSENYYEEEGIKYLQNFLVEKEKKLTSYDKGRIYYYMGDLDNAKVYLEDARDDDDQNTVFFLGKTYEKLGDYNYAASVYDSFLKRHPESALIYNEMGISKLESGDYAGAMDAFISAKNIDNNGMEQTLMYNEIVAYEYNGDFAKAKNLMSAYVSKYPDDRDAEKESTFLSTR